MPQPGFSRERRVHRSHTPTRLATAQPRLSAKWGHGTPLPGEAASRATTEQRSEARGLWCCVGAGRWGGAASGPRRNGQDELESEFRSGVDNNVYGEKDVRHLWDPQTGKDLIWESLREEAAVDAEQEPLLSGFLHGSVLSHSNFEQALAAVLAQRLASRTLLATHVRNPRCVPSPPPSALPTPSPACDAGERNRGRRGGVVWERRCRGTTKELTKRHGAKTESFRPFGKLDPGARPLSWS